MMIGEIRDLETAEIAVQAALTGHLVLSTLHTNNAASAIPRLLDMGVKDYLLTSTVNGIMAQRLVRALCTECRVKETPLSGLVEQLGMTDELRQLVLGHAEVHRIEKAALEGGMRGMYEDGARKALAGVTTIEEVLSATQVV